VVEHDGLRFTVIETEGNRIERLEVEFQPVPTAVPTDADEGPEADQAA
jgi:hypothetical protein